MKPLIHCTLGWLAAFLAIPPTVWIGLAIRDGIHEWIFPCILVAISLLCISCSQIFKGIQMAADADNDDSDFDETYDDSYLP